MLIGLGLPTGICMNKGNRAYPVFRATGIEHPSLICAARITEPSNTHPAPIRYLQYLPHCPLLGTRVNVIVLFLFIPTPYPIPALFIQSLHCSVRLNISFTLPHLFFISYIHISHSGGRPRHAFNFLLPEGKTCVQFDN